MSLLACFRGSLTGPEAMALGAVDLEYAVSVARRVASFGTYARGFRPAGSEAARQCAEYLEAEMRGIGVPQVAMMTYPLDGWEFAGARVEVESGGAGPIFEAVAYGGAVGTNPEGLAGELVDCGHGTVADYARVDVRGKIALVEMDLDALSWPGVALMEAEHHGAVGVVCWPAGRYAMSPGSFHCHDLQVHSDVPMINVTRADGPRLRQFPRVRLFSTARPLPGATGRNIVGIIPGTERPDELVIIGDHYDAWFDGFMDDAVGVGAVLSLARAIVTSGYRPRRTLAFVLHDAEEYGHADTPWDWCAGAHAQITTLTPEWAGKAVGAVIFELCGFRDAHTYDWYVSPELFPLAADVLERLEVRQHYAQGSRLYPTVTTWEDAFSYTAAGIPSAANLEIPDFVRSHYYHTQFDTEDLLDREKYALHVAGLGLLALRMDQAPVPPLDLRVRARHLREALPPDAPRPLLDLVGRLEQVSMGTAAGLLEAAGILNRGLTWIGGESLDETEYPHEQPLRDLGALREGCPAAVTGMGWGQHVSYPVYRRQHFRQIDEPDRNWQWASGRVSPYIDVWQIVKDGAPVSPEQIRQAEEGLTAAYAHEMQVLRQALEALERR